MYLTVEEQAMLVGNYGKGIQLAMEIVVKMGEMYGAKKLLKVKRAHIDAAAYSTIWDAGIDFVEYLANNDAKVAVPTSINPTSRDINNWQALGTTESFSDKCAQLEKAYMKLGVSPTWTCAPYQCTNTPVFGEIVSWSESNAVVYVNSVLGARANRLPDLVDVCCAVIGRVPEYGMFLKENRAGDVLFKLEGFDEAWFTDAVDYALLGYLVGEYVINKIPVIEGLPEQTSTDQLKSLSAASASGGAVALFHAVGLTPEATTIEDAFQGKIDYEKVIIGPKDLQAIKEKLTTANQSKVDMVLLGCPLLSFSEIQEVYELMGDKPVAEGVRFWIQTSQTMYDLASRTGVRQAMEQLGVQFVKDTCILLSDSSIDWSLQTLVTNSGKAAQYVPGMTKTGVAILSTQACVQAALSGRWY